MNYGANVTCVGLFKQSNVDVRQPVPSSLAANVDAGHDIRCRTLALLDSAGARGGFVASIIGRELGLP